MDTSDVNFEFDKNNNRILFSSECRLSSIAQQNEVKTILHYLTREDISVFTIDLSLIEVLDLSAELFIYQLLKLFKKNKDKRLVVRSRDENYQQRKLIQNILKIDGGIQLEFT